MSFNCLAKRQIWICLANYSPGYLQIKKQQLIEQKYDLFSILQ
jgi:hypothetical protein